MADDWKKQAAQRVKSLSEGNSLKLVAGENTIRVLPDKKDLLPDGRVGPKGLTHSPVREFKMHYKVGPDKQACGCGKDLDGNGECWLCDKAIPALAKIPAKNKIREEMEAADIFVVNASRFNTETQRFEPAKAFKPSNSGPNGLAVKIYSRLTTSKKDYLDPVKGHNMTITKTGEGMSTRYPSIEGDENPTAVPRTILAAMKDLDELIPTYSETNQKNAYYGRAAEDEPVPIEEDGDGEAAAEDQYDDSVEEIPAEEIPEGEEIPEDVPEEADPDAPEEEYVAAEEGEPAEEYVDPDAAEEPEPEPEPEPAPARPVARRAAPAPAPAAARPTAAPAARTAPARTPAPAARPAARPATAPARPAAPARKQAPAPAARRK